MSFQALTQFVVVLRTSRLGDYFLGLLILIITGFQAGTFVGPLFLICLHWFELNKIQSINSQGVWFFNFFLRILTF